MGSVPHEAFTSLRCLRDASQHACSPDVLLPAPLRGGEQQTQMGPEYVPIMQHPLAAHIPLWSAHVLRLVHATARLAELFPEQWGTRKWTVDEVLNSDAVSHLWKELQAVQGTEVTQLRASLRIDQNGSSRAVIAPLAYSDGNPLPVRLDTKATSFQEPTVTLKTDLRAEYDASRQRVNADLAGSQPDTCFDALLWTESDENPGRFLTESSIANIVLHVPGEGWITPPFQGILPGLLVQELVRQGKVVQQPLEVDRAKSLLQSGSQLWLGNAVRGLFPVVLK